MKDITIDRIFMIATAITFVIVVGWITWDIYATLVTNSANDAAIWAEQMVEHQRIADANYANLTREK